MPKLDVNMLKDYNLVYTAEWKHWCDGDPDKDHVTVWLSRRPVELEQLGYQLPFEGLKLRTLDADGAMADIFLKLDPAIKEIILEPDEELLVYPDKHCLGGTALLHFDNATGARVSFKWSE